MTIVQAKKYLDNLTSHITFVYDGHDCGVDPLSINSFDIWCDDDEINVSSVNEVFNAKIFNGKSLIDIWDDITDLEY